MCDLGLQEPEVEAIYNHMDSNFTYSKTGPGCSFLRYELMSITSDRQSFALGGSPEECRTVVPEFAPLPWYASVRVSDAGCPAPAEGGASGLGVSTSNLGVECGDGGPSTEAGLTGMSFEPAIGALTLDFCYRPCRVVTRDGVPWESIRSGSAS